MPSASLLRRAAKKIGKIGPVAKITGLQTGHWSRIVMRREMDRMILAAHPELLDALEISGSFGERYPFRRYVSLHFPEFDLCEDPVPSGFSMIIAEQVFEHLLWPYRAGRKVYEALEPGGFFWISTPFLVRVHDGPDDCTRWTPTGMRYFLAECGFGLEEIEVGSWGNRACVEANFRDWTPYRSRLHSLENEPLFPYHVWALARK